MKRGTNGTRSALLPVVMMWGCAASYTEPSEQRVVDIDGARRACVGEAVQQCLVVRWAGDSAWGNLYDEIEGFTHEPGYRVRLVVERIPVRNPPADGSSFRYRLLRACSRVSVADTARLAPLRTGVAQCR